jgi:hypothetical protein
MLLAFSFLKSSTSLEPLKARTREEGLLMSENVLLMREVIFFLFNREY